MNKLIYFPSEKQCFSIVKSLAMLFIVKLFVMFSCNEIICNASW